MERNLRLYPIYQSARNALFWLPVFFLYFSSVLPLEQVFLLEAVYYLAVVVLEVPSGYFSDRMGRKPTLIIAMACWGSSGLVFAATASFGWFALAQVLLAAGMAFNSGTDTSLLYDSLAAADRTGEIGDREARAEAWGYAAAATSALAGGLAGGFDLRLAYLLSAAGGLAGLGIASSFREPAHVAETPETALVPHRQLGVCLERLADPVLRWIFLLVVGMTVFVHVPYELLQPYLDLLVGPERGDWSPTPALTGALMAASYYASAWASTRAIRLRDRIGTVATLLGALAIQGAIILAMGLVLHWAVAALFIVRSAPWAAVKPIMRAAVHPRLERGIRATYLSLQSLAGRLAFSASLAAASLLAGGVEDPSYLVLSRILLAYFIVAVGLFLVLIAMARPVVRAER